MYRVSELTGLMIKSIDKNMCGVSSAISGLIESYVIPSRYPGGRSPG